MAKDGLFFYEPFSDHLTRSIRVDRVLFEGKTRHQAVHCFYNKVLGKTLFLDRRIQSAQVDEFVYHEALVHPSLLTHSRPEKVLVIGGAEGATVRECLRHNSVVRAVMVDIDGELVKICQEHLPEWSEGAFSNSKTELVVGDARQYVETSKEKFDVIISDLTEPLKEGPSVYLFTREFFDGIAQSLTDDGIFVLQAGSADPYYNDFFQSCRKTLDQVFPSVRLYWTFIFSFGLPWGFMMASKKEGPLQMSDKEIQNRMDSRGISLLKFFHAGIYKGLFSLPLYLIRDFSKGRVMTDKKPFIWTL